MQSIINYWATADVDTVNSGLIAKGWWFSRLPAGTNLIEEEVFGHVESFDKLREYLDSRFGDMKLAFVHGPSETALLKKSTRVDGRPCSWSEDYFACDGTLFVSVTMRFDATRPEEEDKRFVNVTLVGTDPVRIAQLHTELRQIIPLNLGRKRKAGRVKMLVNSGQGPEFQTLPNHIQTEFIPENYEPEVLKLFERIRSDLESDKPNGRIGILDGPPGTGKTHLVRGLMTTTDADKATFVFVAPKDVSHLSDPSFLPALIRLSQDVDSHIVFVIEDADECLAPRGADNMPSVSAILNLGDGILGELLDIRMVMTTNAKRQEFDPAITRPGRLSACARVGNLSVDRANTIFKRLTGKDGTFTGPKSLAEVYSAASDAGFIPVSNEKPIGFGR